ncbi:unnamed protein product [Ostreobium quekettii]|uniref:Uncharacterized protein n=1 Tax=Ostreobium quekettii TaxID=121088 RepID=A0A8S1J0S6_9CHLO|nr:unnamed protein product [Ostreobium quekettii]
MADAPEGEGWASIAEAPKDLPDADSMMHTGGCESTAGDSTKRPMVGRPSQDSAQDTHAAAGSSGVTIASTSPSPHMVSDHGMSTSYVVPVQMTGFPANAEGAEASSSAAPTALSCEGTMTEGTAGASGQQKPAGLPGNRGGEVKQRTDSGHETARGKLETNMVADAGQVHSHAQEPGRHGWGRTSPFEVEAAQLSASPGDSERIGADATADHSRLAGFEGRTSSVDIACPQTGKGDVVATSAAGAGEGVLERETASALEPRISAVSRASSISDINAVDLVALADEVRRLEQELRAVQENYAQCSDQLQEAESQVEDLQAELRAVTEAYASLRVEAETSKEEVQEMKLELEALGGSEGAKAKLGELRKKIEREVREHLKGRLARAEAAIEAERAQVLALERRLQEEHQGTSEQGEVLERLHTIEGELAEACSAKAAMSVELRKQNERCCLLEDAVQRREEQLQMQGEREQEYTALQRDLKELRESHNRLLMAARTADDRAAMSEAVTADTKVQIEAASQTITKLVQENAALSDKINKQGRLIVELREMQSRLVSGVADHSRTPSMDDPLPLNEASLEGAAAAKGAGVPPGGHGSHLSPASTSASLPDPPSIDGAGASGSVGEQEVESVVAAAQEQKRAPVVLKSRALTPVAPMRASSGRRWSWDFGVWKYISGGDLVQQ